MSILCPGGLPERDRLGNPILTGFGNMLRLPVLAADDALDEAEKTVLAAKLLYGRVPEALDAQAAMDELLWFFHCGREPVKDGAPPLFDFEQDAELIYASFLQVYGMDLAVVRPHWWAFCALFAALPEDCALGRVMRLRAADPVGLPAAQRAALARQKRMFALKRDLPADGGRDEGLAAYAERRWRQAAAWAGAKGAAGINEPEMR